MRKILKPLHESWLSLICHFRQVSVAGVVRRGRDQRGTAAEILLSLERLECFLVVPLLFDFYEIAWHAKSLLEEDALDLCTVDRACSDVVQRLDEWVSFVETMLQEIKPKRAVAHVLRALDGHKKRRPSSLFAKALSRAVQGVQINSDGGRKPVPMRWTDVPDRGSQLPADLREKLAQVVVDLRTSVSEQFESRWGQETGTCVGRGRGARWGVSQGRSEGTN